MPLHSRLFVIISVVAVALCSASTPPPQNTGVSVPAGTSPGAGPPSGSSATTTTCGLTASASWHYQSVSGTVRTLIASGCPGYSYTSQTTGNPTYIQCISMATYLNPILQTTPLYVGTSNPILGNLGVAINGASIYGPTDALGRDAVVNEGVSMDTCFGHSDPSGEYHYHSVPTAGCVYNDTAGQHSPLFGIMADGIPIYGKLDVGGVAPNNLDTCGGHVGPTPSGGNFYHYHGQSSYPYLVNCLMGCLQPGSIKSSNASNYACTNKAATQYDYTSIANAFPTVPSGYSCVSAAPTATPSSLLHSSTQSVFSQLSLMTLSMCIILVMAMMI